MTGKCRLGLVVVAVLLWSSQPMAQQSAVQIGGEFQRQLVSPFGVQDRQGIDSIGETLLDPEARQELSYYLFQQEVVSRVAAAEDSTRWGKLMGYGIKGVGRGLGAFGGSLSSTDGLSPLVAGGGAALSAIVGGAVEDVGESLVNQYETLATARVAFALHEVYGDVFRPNGQLDEGRLKELGTSEVRRMLDDPKVMESIGNPAVTADLKATITVDLLTTMLSGQNVLQKGVENIEQQLVLVRDSLDEVQYLQRSALSILSKTNDALEQIDVDVNATRSMVEALALKELPPSQILALFESGALHISEENAVERLRLAAEVERFQKDVNVAAGYFKETAAALSNLGVDPEFTTAVSTAGSLIEAGGALAIAVSASDPFSTFTAASAVVGVFKSFGNRGESAESKMLKRIFQELRRLSEQIAENHAEQMDALRRIDLKLVNLEATMNQRFVELGLDVALLQFDTRELLYDDVRACEALAEEFFLPETMDLLSLGFLGMAIWFETDNRPAEYARCLDGLTLRQRVDSEIDFSGMLRAYEISDSQGGLSADARRDSVRRVELRTLQPTVSFLIQRYGSMDGEAIARHLYRAYFDLCDVVNEFGDANSLACEGRTDPDSLGSAIAFSQFNPGQGALLSPTTALAMARYTRVLAPWNGILIERTTGSVPRVISAAEAVDRSVLAASRRTRHLRAIVEALGALDINIGQSNVLAGIPAIVDVAKILDEQILPAYAQARYLAKPERLNRLLAAPPPNRSFVGARCSTGNSAWDALCLMEANPSLAQNALRLLIAMRLHRNGHDLEDWRAALRSPFSQTMQSLVGNDVIFHDTGAQIPDSALGVWSIELPRVYSDPTKGYPATVEELSGTLKEQSCWDNGLVPLLFRDGRIDTENSYYSANHSSRCYLLDSFRAENFIALETPSPIAALLTERMLLEGLLTQLCGDNDRYPSVYCGRVIMDLAATTIAN